jgi:multiple sugar transport system substrate-binding protein
MSQKSFLLLVVLLVVLVFLGVVLSTDDPSQFVIFSTWGTSGEVESFQHAIDHYNATRHPRCRVRLSHAEQNQYTERLFIQAAARNMPDVIHVDRKDLPLIVHRRLFEDLTPFIDADSAFHLSDFLPELLPGGRVGGRLYAIPHNLSTLVLYYNRDHFDAEGLAYPDSTWTWETLRRAAERLTRKDAGGRITRYGCLMTLTIPTLIYQNGGQILNATLDSCVVASPEAEGAVQFIVDLSEKYHVSWSYLAQNLQWDDMFAGGRLSMIANGRWSAAWYARSMPPGAVDVAPLPRGKLRKGGAVSHMMALSSQSTKKEEAWAFLKYLVSEEGERMFNEDGANIPALRSVVLSDAFLRHPATPAMNNRVFLDELPSSVVWPYEQGVYLTQLTIQTQLDLALRRILLGQATVMASLQIMEDNLNAAIATQRQISEPKAFVGSVLFFACLGAVAVCPLAIWRFGRRKPSQ